MTARIIAIESEEHRAVQELLPWFANGTLTSGESERVRTHIGQCARCQADTIAQGSLRAAAAEVATPSLDVERGWAAVRARLSPARRPAREQPSWGSRFGWPVLASAQAIAVAVLAVVVVVVMRSAPQGTQYQALGSSLPIASANALVVFRPAATEAQLRQALRASGARIVDGPTVTDAYLVHLPSTSPAALAKLGANPAVSRVESLQGGPQ